MGKQLKSSKFWTLVDLVLRSFREFRPNRNFRRPSHIHVIGQKFGVTQDVRGVLHEYLQLPGRLYERIFGLHCDPAVAGVHTKPLCRMRVLPVFPAFPFSDRGHVLHLIGLVMTATTRARQYGVRFDPTLRPLKLRHVLRFSFCC